MTSWNNFLSTILPEEGLGWYCIGTYKKKTTPKQYFVKTIAEAETYIQQLLDDKKDVYFGCSKYITNENRKAINAGWQKSFWLDLDCGQSYADAGTGYLSQVEALMDVARLCKELHLPKPNVISSGNGLHVHWVMENAIEKEEWAKTCEYWKQQLKRLNIIADPSKITDVAAVLRVPDTHNFKSDPPLNVEWLKKCPPMEYEDFRAKVMQGIEIELDLTKAPRRPMDETTRKLLGNKVSNFDAIMRSKECTQLNYAFKNQPTIDYNQWRGALSIAQFCEDRDTAIHKMSEKHPEYSPQDTEYKANDIGGPYHCLTLERNNPGHCDGCIHKGKITSPISINSKIAKATAEDNVVVLKSAAIETEITYKIPELPYPYFRGKNGGIYKQGFINEEGEEVEKDKLIFKHDFYIVKRMEDPELGDMVWMRVHMPKDGVREFACSNQSLMVTDRFKDTVAPHGVIGNAKEMAEIMNYITTFAKDLQERETTEKMRTQFGWCDNDSKFIIGDKEISATGIQYSPPSNTTLPFVGWFKPKGTMEEWKRVADVYSREGQEMRAFMLFVGLGAPLLKFTNQKGLIFSLVSNESATGKTSIQRMINSIWGHPTDIMLIAKDTLKSQFHQFGVFNNIAICTDEVTAMSEEAVSNIAYGVSQGRSNNRMKANSNEMRLNNTHWALPAIFSGNSSMHDKMATLKATPESEQLRIVEMEVPQDTTMSKEESDALFEHVLTDNYGHIGPALVQYMVANLDSVKKILIETQKRFDADAKLSQKQRFYSAGAAMAFTAGIIANELGLIKVDIDKVWAWAVDYFSNLRESVQSAKADPLASLGTYLNEFNRNLLVVDDANDKRTGLTKAPLKIPYGPLMNRFEPDTGLLWIAVDQLRLWCTKKQIGYSGIIDGIKALDPDAVIKKKGMAKGSELDTFQVNALGFNAEKAKLKFNITPQEPIEE
jgi:hypothetical protein